MPLSPEAAGRLKQDHRRRDALTMPHKAQSWLDYCRDRRDPNYTRSDDEYSDLYDEFEAQYEPPQT